MNTDNSKAPRPATAVFCKDGVYTIFSDGADELGRRALMCPVDTSHGGCTLVELSKMGYDEMFMDCVRRGHACIACGTDVCLPSGHPLEVVADTLEEVFTWRPSMFEIKCLADAVSAGSLRGHDLAHPVFDKPAEPDSNSRVLAQCCEDQMVKMLCDSDFMFACAEAAGDAVDNCIIHDEPVGTCKVGIPGSGGMNVEFAVEQVDGCPGMAFESCAYPEFDPRGEWQERAFAGLAETSGDPRNHMRPMDAGCIVPGAAIALSGVPAAVAALSPNTAEPVKVAARAVQEFFKNQKVSPAFVADAARKAAKLTLDGGGAGSGLNDLVH